MNGSYAYPSYDGSANTWTMMPQYYAPTQYDHVHHSQQVPVQVPQHQAAYPTQALPDGRHYANGYGYPYVPSYAPQPQQQSFAIEQAPRSRFAFAAAPALQAHQFALPPPAYPYPAQAYSGVDEQMRSQSRERAAAWGVGGDFGRQESASRATLHGERHLQFLLARLAQSSADLESSRAATPDSYEAPALQDDDKSVVYDLIPNTSSVPPPPPVELSAVPLADLAVELVWDACRQGFLLYRDNQMAAAHAQQSSSTRRRSARESFGTIGDGRLRNASADGFASDASSAASSSPGTPGFPSAQEEEARRVRLANIGLADFMPYSSSRKSSVASLSSSVFPVEPSVAFRQFVKQILNATLVTPEDLVLALYYVSQIAPSEIIPPTPAEGGQDAQTTSFKAAPFKIILGALMLANKSNQDNSYRNETFATVSGIPLRDVNALEIYVFSALKYDVALREDKWIGWLNTLAFRVLGGVRGEIGSRLAIEEALGRLVHAARNNKNLAAPVSSVRPVSVPVPAIPSTPVAQSLGDLDLDASGPLEDKVPRRRGRQQHHAMAQDSPLLAVAASRAGAPGALCRSSTDVNCLLPPVSLADTRSRSFGQELRFNAIC
ncbi:hypothetical protein JCM10212_002550 [Sporobolomyces blumeae]